MCREPVHAYEKTVEAAVRVLVSVGMCVLFAFLACVDWQNLLLLPRELPRYCVRLLVWLASVVVVLSCFVSSAQPFAGEVRIVTCFDSVW